VVPGTATTAFYFLVLLHPLQQLLFETSHYAPIATAGNTPMEGTFGMMMVTNETAQLGI
jgi:membrane-bound lytic murein transglycosylase MltF